MVPTTFVWLEALPLTPQGKVDRAALPAPPSDAAGWDAEPVGTVAPRTPAEARLAQIWAQVLGLDHVGIHDNFFSLGGDSILSLQIIARASQDGLRLTPRQLFECQTVAELAAVAETAPARPSEESLVAGPIPLTPIQQWFFEQELPQPHHWNQAVLLEMREELDPASLERAFHALVAHHDALRLRFHPMKGGWRQVTADSEANPIFSSVDLSALGESERVSALREAAAKLQAGLDLSKGPLMRAARFDLGPGRRGRLLWAIHHLAVDGVSWRILIEDLQHAYDQVSRGAAIRLPPRTTAFGRWAQRLQAYAQSPELRQELEYWTRDSRLHVPSLPVDRPESRNTQGSARTVWVALDEEETRSLLQDVPAAYGTQINDCLLTAVTEAFAQWTGRRVLLLDLEGHGREDVVDGVDLSRTVGWFTTICPVLLDLTNHLTPGDALKSMKEQLRGIPRRGIGYGLLRYLSGDGAIVERLRAFPQPQVSFNYLGQFDQTLGSSCFEWAAEPIETSHDTGGTRRHLLSINGSIRANRLQIGWTYSSAVHRPATVEALAQRFLTALRALISHCRTPGVGGYTPSDFPDAGLDQQQLDALIAGLDETVSEA
jgi:non-ribosomal peptide synthase protein (TIGR01720 family)